MVNRNSNISFEEELDLLGIDYDDYQYISDGSYGYFLVLVTDLDNDQEKKLTDHPDYFQITDDLWGRRLETPTEVPEEIKIKILDFKNQKEIERVEKDYLVKIKNRWQSIVLKKEKLNEIGIDKNGDNFFPATKETEKVAALLGTFLATSQGRFREFCRHLFCYFNEFRPEQVKIFKKT